MGGRVFIAGLRDDVVLFVDLDPPVHQLEVQVVVAKSFFENIQALMEFFGVVETKQRPVGARGEADEAFCVREELLEAQKRGVVTLAVGNS